MFIVGTKRWFLHCSQKEVVSPYDDCLALIIKTMPNVNVCIPIDRNKCIYFVHPRNSRTFAPD